jgi:DNA replication protein DnaC
MNGSSFLSIGAAEFSIGCSSRWGDKLAQWLLPFKTAGILLIDDLGKERAATEHVASTMYSLIEARTSQQRPILFTTNHSTVEIATAYGARHGEYLVRRLRDYCQFIEVE